MDSDVVDGAVKSVIGRVVAAFAPVLAGGVGSGLLWVQNVIGIDLQHYKGAAAAFLGTIILGGCLTAWQWLRNRGAHEIEVLRAVYERGASAQTPTVPPGLN